MHATPADLIQPPPPPAGAPVPAAATLVPARGSSDRQWLIAALVASGPLLFVVLLTVVAPGFLEPLLDDAVTLMGLPFIVPLLVLCVGAVLLSTVLAWRVRPPWIGIVVAALWFPVGCVLVLLGPAFALIMANLPDIP